MRAPSRASTFFTKKLKETLRSNDATATKTSLKKWICVLHSLSQLFLLTYLVKCTRTLLNLNSKGPYSSSESEIKFLPCLFTFSTKHEIRHFHVLIVQKRQRNEQKAWCTCKVVLLLIKRLLFLEVLLAVVSLNFKAPNLKKIGDYLQPKPGGITDYGSWPKRYPHHNTISRYTSRVNLILINLRAKIHNWYFASLGEQIPMLQRV